MSADEREELKQLRKENRLLRMEKEILKKSASVPCERNEVKYGFIQDQASDYPANVLCQMLDAQRSAYYDWPVRPNPVIASEELALRRRMKELFATSRGSLGSHMMMRNLRSEGFELGRE